MKSEKPKALVELKGKTFLKHILDTLSSMNFPLKPIIVVGHKKEEIIEAIGRDYHYAYQKDQLGTGHAVLSSKHKVDNKAETVFILSTDQPLVSKKTISEIIRRHKKKKSSITIGTLILPDFLDWRIGLVKFGRIIRGENGKIIKNVEYKDATEEEKKITEVNPAIYAFNTKWLWKNIKKNKKTIMLKRNII